MLGDINLNLIITTDVSPIIKIKAAIARNINLLLSIDYPLSYSTNINTFRILVFLSIVCH
jgi:hypothetical protein